MNHLLIRFLGDRSFHCKANAWPNKSKLGFPTYAELVQHHLWSYVVGGY